MVDVESYSIVSNRRRIVEAKLQRERELRQELDELGVQNVRKLLSIRRDRHQFIERYYYLCKKAELISKRCAESRNCDACVIDLGAIHQHGEKTVDKPEVGARRVVCCGSTNLPPLWLSCAKDVSATVACLSGNADGAKNQARRKLRPHFIGIGPKLPTTTRQSVICTTLPPVRSEGKRDKYYHTTVSNEEVRTNCFPPISHSDPGQAAGGQRKGKFRPLAKFLVGLLKKENKLTMPEYRRRSHEKVLLTVDELSTCRYLRMPNDISPWAKYSPSSSTLGSFR